MTTTDPLPAPATRASSGAVALRRERRSLLDRLREGEVRAAVTFAGQGLDPFDELTILLRDRPELRDLLAEVSDHLRFLLDEPAVAASGRFRHGLDLLSWVDDPDGAPDARYRASTLVSLPLVMTTQLLSWRALQDDGLTDVPLVAVTGHSQGILAALCVAEHPATPLDAARIGRHLTLVVHEGLHIVGGRTAPVGEVGPMVAVGDIEADRLAAEVAAVNEATGSHLVVALRNTRTRHVVAGEPTALRALHRRLDRAAADDADARAAGRLGGAPLQFTWNPLPVEVPFHSPLVAGRAESFAAWLRQAELLGDASALGVPVLSPHDGHDLRDEPDLAAAIARSHFAETVDWPSAVTALADAGADWILDVGPGTDVARFTAASVRGRGTRVLALASPEGRRVLLTPGASPTGPDVTWADFAPTLVRTPDGTVRVDNAYSRATGKPPVILAGMTPTTVDVPIVAAAANAGFAAELAGGGQPTAAILEKRLDELAAALDPGVEVAFNTLLLDRHLWELHLGRDRAVEAARGRGAPIGGITVSAGVPEVDEAVSLLDRWASHGIVANAFKCGTVAQVRQVVAIAAAATHHTVQLHLEGGVAGGHHSWEDLEELLLAVYADVRRQANVLLCVGGGVATPERAASLVTGEWSRRHGEVAMPVDAVLVGTAAMACREATASPAVKAALVAASGADGWVARGDAEGGVASALSSLRADIHVLDNAAAAAAQLCAEVAGDPEALVARYDEIVATLARTAKPYFGDLATMTYGGVLARYVELAAIGRGGPYEDGAWLDPSWRRRGLALFRRFAARLWPDDRGEVETPVATLADLDDPPSALAAFATVFPTAASTVLHPADIDPILETFAGGGKPVNFVPVIDAELRRWYLADALWQAQDDRYDADQVVVIPGPAAVAGIAVADEPVADLLGRFDAGVIDAVRRSGARVVERDSVRTAVAAPSVLREAAAHSGPLAALCRAAAVIDPRRTDDPLADPPIDLSDGAGGSALRPNPLWRWIRPGDAVDLQVHDGELVALTARPSGSESVHARVVPGDGPDGGGTKVEVRVELAGVGGATDLLEITFESVRPGPTGPFRIVGGTADRRRSLRRILSIDGGHGEWRVSADLVAAYRAATGATHDGTPLDLAFSLGWPALAELLVDGPLADGLDELVHERHRVEPGPAWPPAADGRGTANARILEVVDDATCRRFTAAVDLDGADGRVATVTAAFRILRPQTRTGWRRSSSAVAATIGGSAGPPLADVAAWLAGVGVEVEPVAGDASTVAALDGTAWADESPTTTRQRGAGTLTAPDGAVVARLRLDRTVERVTVDPDRAAEVEHPFDVVVDALDAGTPDVPGEVAAVERRTVATVADRAPATSTTFALVGGDRNPLHRSVLAARGAGLDAPIVHGMWTAARASAAVVDSVAGGDADRLVEWSVDFTAPVAHGADLAIRIDRTALHAGTTRYAVAVEADDVTVATAVAVVAGPRTAWAFPGQGTQHPRMGADVRARSTDAAATWAVADRVTRERLGFSIVDVVDRNPTVAIVDGAEVRHPAGVLFRTELTQVALTVTAAAQLAELRAAGVVDQPDVAVGHSAGEFNALMALGVLPLDATIELVFRRGVAMQRHVPRDASGASPFRLAVVDPSRAGLHVDEVAAVLDRIAAERGEVLEFANHNARGRQHAVVGHAAAIDVLAARLGASAVKVVDGIDVPFHSSVLRGAVDDLRAALEALVPAFVDHRRLVGRWIPNVTGTPFALDPSPGESADGAARRQLIDLLARQLAAPVRWVDVMDRLVATPAAGGLGVERLVEVGPAASPVLTQLARDLPVERRHSEHDRAALFALDADDLVDGDDEPEPTPALAPDPLVAVGASPATAPDDVPFGPAQALRMVLATQAMVRPDQIDDTETIEELFQGASSRRNQVLIDLGREFDLSGVDGAHERPIRDLAADLAAGATRYRFPGGYLKDSVGAGLSRALGRSGLGRRDVARDLADRYGFGPGLVDHVVARLVLGTRPGASARGGALGEWADAPVTSAADGRALLDRAVAAVGADLGRSFAPVRTGADGAVDPAAIAAASGGLADALAASATDLLDRLGRTVVPAGEPLVAADESADRLDVLDAELGAARADAVRPAFDPRRHVRIESAAAMARWDLIDLFHRSLDEPTGLAPEAERDIARLAPHGTDPVVAATVGWLSSRAVAHGRSDLAEALRRVDGRPGPPALAVADAGAIADLLPDALSEVAARRAAAAGDHRHDVALVTGAAPGSIAASLVAELLRGGATVVATASDLTLARRRWFRELYRRHAAPGARLHLLPANLASFADIDALVEWLAAPAAVQRQRPDLVMGPLRPTIVVPFAATSTLGDLRDSGAASEVALRVQLLGVERLVAAIGAWCRRDGAAPAHVVLPLSPNHGVLGGDGPYAETKAALEVLVERRRSEAAAWGDGVTIAAARIGWVRGTGLTAAGDSFAVDAEAFGIRTFSAAEMGWLVGVLCDRSVRDRLDRRGPVIDVDLTGGFDGRFGGTTDGVTVSRSSPGALTFPDVADRTRPPAAPPLVALPNIDPVDGHRSAVARPATEPTPEPQLDPSQMVVIVGAAELGPCGPSGARAQIERRDALDADGIVEIAWLCGLVRYERNGYRGRWIDAATDAEVPEHELADRYAELVGARVGLRPIEDDGVVDAAGIPVLVAVHLDRDLTFDVASEADARAFVDADPEHTDARRDADSGEWRVTRRAGATIRVPRRAPLSRRVAGQFPTGLDLGRFGLPGDLLASADRMALVNLACTAGAFADAGLEPEELMAAVHPALVGNTQGSGQGGMASGRRMMLDGLLGEDRQPDRLQEGLVNVVAAHAVQGYVGSYGPMVHPVAACATAAVSLEEAVDKITAGKALVVVAGGYDDLTPEGIVGFGDMGATASSEDLDAMGIMPCEASRAGDLRRRGFVESQGGGAFLVMRGDVALALGAPVRGVLAYAGSFADGIHTSIPAPGMGALACATGGADSPLATALRRHGLAADDIAVVSKHDTSTEMNDPNEADLHQRIQDAIGRTPGNPLMVVSQKTVTGHAKGGAAAWQVAGVLQMMETGIVPGNRTLESADPAVTAASHLAVGHTTVQRAAVEPVRAALVTSLGFGHVSAVLAIAHPDVFVAAVPAAERDDYLARAAARRVDGRRRDLARRVGRGAEVRRTDRRIDLADGRDAREAEAEMLLDPSARLAAGGTFVARRDVMTTVAEP